MWELRGGTTGRSNGEAFDINPVVIVAWQQIHTLKSKRGIVLKLVKTTMTVIYLERAMYTSSSLFSPSSLLCFGCAAAFWFLAKLILGSSCLFKSQTRKKYGCSFVHVPLSLSGFHLLPNFPYLGVLLSNPNITRYKLVIEFIRHHRSTPLKMSIQTSAILLPCGTAFYFQLPGEQRLRWHRRPPWRWGRQFA